MIKRIKNVSETFLFLKDVSFRSSTVKLWNFPEISNRTESNQTELNRIELVRSNLTHKNIKILKNFGLHEPEFYIETESNLIKYTSSVRLNRTSKRTKHDKFR
jgi:hypothetical protein